MPVELEKFNEIRPHTRLMARTDVAYFSIPKDYVLR